MEREYIRDRTLEGQESARTRGKSIGGASVTDNHMLCSPTASRRLPQPIVALTVQAQRHEQPRPRKTPTPRQHGSSLTSCSERILYSPVLDSTDLVSPAARRTMYPSMRSLTAPAKSNRPRRSARRAPVEDPQFAHERPQPVHIVGLSIRVEVVGRGATLPAAERKFASG